MKKPQPAGEQAIEGYVAIAQTLSGIMGAPVTRWQVSRLMDRRRHPLPVRGYIGRRWAFLTELQEWWAEMDEYGKRVGRKREEMTA